MDNMIKSLKDILLSNTQKIRKQYKKTRKMMFPIRQDVNLGCGRTSEKEPNPIICKVVRLLLAAVVFCFFLIILNSFYPLEENEVKKDENPGSVPSSPTPPPPPPPPPPQACKLENGEKLKEEGEIYKTEHRTFISLLKDRKELQLKKWIQQEIQHQNKACSKAQRVTPEQMRNMVKEEIKRQQKIQHKPDFASASAGGMVLEASPTWTEGYSYIYFLFIPIRSTAPPPSIVLEPTRQVGDCWPMEGKKGGMLIQLAARANIVAFTMEHIDPAMSLSGGTPEAPHNFSVYGVEWIENKKQKHLFGTYSYNNKNDEPSQYFRVQHIIRKSFMYILLEITSNHGNNKYTCIYRFQVHGFIDRSYYCEK